MKDGIDCKTEGNAMRKNTALKPVTVEIPSHNIRDVEFLDQIRQAHDHDNLADIGTAVKKAFKRRVEEEFLGQDITPKTRASITEFCEYLLSIARFSGYSLMSEGIVTSTHNDMFSIKTRPVHGINALLDATFTYFDTPGNYKMTASGFMRWDWSIAPDDPNNRRIQIIRDNNGTMPGYASENELCERFFIHVEVSGQFPLLVLPVK